MFFYGQEQGDQRAAYSIKSCSVHSAANLPVRGLGTTLRDGTEHLKTDGERKKGFISLRLLDCFGCRLKMNCFALLRGRTVSFEAIPRLLFI